MDGAGGAATKNSSSTTDSEGKEKKKKCESVLKVLREKGWKVSQQAI